MEIHLSEKKTPTHCHIENETRLKNICGHLANDLDEKVFKILNSLPFNERYSNHRSTFEAINIVSEYLDSDDETRVYFAIRFIAGEFDTSISFNESSVIEHLILEVKAIELFLVHLQKYDVSPDSFMAFVFARCILNALIVIGENTTFTTYIHEKGIIAPLRDELEKIIKKEKVQSMHTYQNAYQRFLGDLAQTILEKIM